MRDLTSTKREFTTLGKRLYRRGPMSINRAFRGVVESGFGVWIRAHWGLSNQSLFRPVPREFETQKKPFALLNWPQPRRSGDVNYTFSPTIRLSCFPQQTNHSLFELNTTGIYQTLTGKQSAGPRDEVSRNVLVKEALHERSLHWLSSLCNLRVVGASLVTFLRNSELQRHTEYRGFTEKAVAGADRSTREYRFLERIIHTFYRESNTRSQSTRLREFLSALFSTFRQTAGEVTQSRDVEKSLQNEIRRFGATSFRRDFALVRSAAATEIHNHSLTLQPSILTRFSNSATTTEKTSQLQGTTNLHTRFDHRFLTSVDSVQGEGQLHYGPSAFTTLALNFAAPKISETELVAKRISQLVSSPELTHIKRQPAMSEEMMNALRGLRTPHVEPKPVTVPVMPSIEQLTNQVRTQLERELRIERERRGL